MMHYNSLLLTLEANNKKSIFYFSLYIAKLFNTILVKHKKGLKNISKFSILRSPHVHKSSQHEFKQQIFKKHFLFVMLNDEILVYMKKLFLNFFQDIKKKFIFIINIKSIINIKFFKINSVGNLLIQYKTDFLYSILKNKKKLYKKELRNYLKILNLIGKTIIS